MLRNPVLASASCNGQERFGEPSFWESRFRANKKSFDWYASFDELNELLPHILRSTVSPNGFAVETVLVVGCGNSEFSHHLSSFYSVNSVTNVDISMSVIQQMQSKYPNQSWLHKDATCMAESLPHGAYNLIVDKGTLDALLCGSDSNRKAHALLDQMGHLVSDTGAILLVSHKVNRMALIEKTERLGIKQIWKCDLSDETIFINSFRSRGVDDAFVRNAKAMSSSLLESVGEDCRHSIKTKKMRRVLRRFLLARGLKDAAIRSSLLYDEAHGILDKDGMIPSGSTRSSFCYLFVVVKR